MNLGTEQRDGHHMSNDISLAISDFIATVEIQRPPNNFFDFDLIREIADTYERLDDVIVTPAPASRSQVLALLDDWKGMRLLDGSAGTPACDIDALVDLTVMVSRFAAGAENVSALDLNPVVVHPRGSGVSVVDALIITDNDTGAGTHLLATD